ncbi:MAG: ABC transporter substrate-binding protein [Dehalococcoidales bacterium]|nr:ABC transporter substrate-binding protein [Dehalococcoidales bacterium]
MKVKYPLLLLTICVLLVVALLAGCSGGGSGNEDKVLKIGMILPATGPAAEKGKPGGDAVKDAMEYVNNELNGAEGYKIQISWRDSGYDAPKVANIINEFINEKDLIFTTMSSKEMTAAQEIANRHGIPGLVTFAAPNNYNPPAHIYCHMPDYGDDWVSFVNYYLKDVWKGSGKPRMALHLLNNTTGSGVKDAAEAKAEAMGVEIVAIEEHTATTTNETESLTRIKSKNPDVIFISSTPQPTSIVLKSAGELGLTPDKVTFGLAHASLSSALVKLAGADVAEGVYGVYPTVTWDDTSLPGIVKAKEYLDKNNPDDAGNMDYLACWSTSLIVAEVLRNAVKEVGYDVLAKGDAEALKAVEEKGIRKLNGYKVDGIQGPVKYTPGSNKLGNSVKIYRIEGGVIKAVTDWIEAK